MQHLYVSIIPIYIYSLFACVSFFLFSVCTGFNMKMYQLSVTEMKVLFDAILTITNLMNGLPMKEKFG